jgi:DNA-directed RNA polymerase specialized sigma24 family protein
VPGQSFESLEELTSLLRERLRACWVAQTSSALGGILFWEGPQAVAALWDRFEPTIDAWSADRAGRLLAAERKSSRAPGAGGKGRKPGAAKPLEAAVEYLLVSLIDASLVEAMKAAPSQVAAEAAGMLWQRLEPQVRFLANRFAPSAQLQGLAAEDLVQEAWAHLMADKTHLPNPTRRRRSGHARITRYDPSRKATVATFVDQVARHLFSDLLKRGKLPEGKTSISLEGRGDHESGRGKALEAAVSEKMNRDRAAKAKIKEIHDAIRACCGILLRGGYDQRKIIAFQSYWLMEKKYREIIADISGSIGWANEAVHETLRRIQELMREHYPELWEEFRGECT